MNASQIPAYAWSVIALTSFAVGAVYLDKLMVFVAFPAIERTFGGASTAELSWVMNAYIIVFASLLVPAGRVGDLVGRRKVFLSGIVVFAASSAWCGLAMTPRWLILARISQAVGGAMLVPSSLGLILEAFPKQWRATAVTLWGAIGALAVAIGPSLGSAMVQWLSWRWAFYINVPLGFVVFLVSLRTLKASRAPDRGGIPDPIGTLTLIAGSSLLALALVHGVEWGWKDGRILSSAMGGCLALGLFVKRSRTVSVPALDVSLFRNDNYRWANIVTLFYGIPFTGMFLGRIYFLTDVWEFSILEAGLGMTPGPLVVMVLAPVAGRLADRYGHRTVLVPGGLVFAAANLYLWIYMTTISQYVAVFLPTVLLSGVGVAFLLPPLSAAAVHELSSDQYAAGSAVNQAIRQFGSVLGVTLVVMILTVFGSGQLVTYRFVFGLLVVGGVVTALMCTQIKIQPVNDVVD